MYHRRLYESMLSSIGDGKFSITIANNQDDSILYALSRIRNNPNITSLIASNICLIDVHVEIIAQVLPISGLKSLDISKNWIGAVGAEHLSKALPNSGLESLNIECNMIGAVGAEHLLRALPISGLKSLNIGYNRIGAVGAVHLSKALPNSGLKSLDNEGNEIGAVGAEHLSRALPNSRLKSLNIRYDAIDSIGAEYLSRALPNSRLKSFNISVNMVGAFGIVSLSRAFKLNNTILTCPGYEDITTWNLQLLHWKKSRPFNWDSRVLTFVRLMRINRGQIDHETEDDQLTQIRGGYQFPFELVSMIVEQLFIEFKSD